MYSRNLDLRPYLSHKSLFLLGPRQTGKSTLLRTLFPNAHYVDLLDAGTFRELSAFPESLRQRLPPQKQLVIIDEVQKLPNLLDEVQLMIDRSKEVRFILTGSSARKLRRGHANLLGGRAWFFNLFPLVSPELNFERLLDRLNYGSLPSIIDSPYPKQDLNAYVGTYLKEEIQAEGLTRSLEGFSRFLTFSALLNAEQLNYTKIGNDAEVPPRTVRDYFQILEDTLIATQVPCYQKTARRKPVSTAKFYFFDIGVANNLSRQGEILEGSTAYGKAIEHLIFQELQTYLSYQQRDDPLTYWRSQTHLEVDFLVGDHTAIEVKATTRVSSADLKGLLALSEELTLKNKIIVSQESSPRWIDDIRVLPVMDFLRALWGGELLPA
ncbi:MAG: hypothetical protein A3J38_07680 [Gammaproteobacteria bacterium RIFCSPHIGHO2_12_FULL_45_9]|nr:MAG: hypothetical protein A3J38_07680 [Gammaproteobacteria bacterium RIFCSPHIGHO2_12_FULL_45_9]